MTELCTELGIVARCANGVSQIGGRTGVWEQKAGKKRKRKMVVGAEDDRNTHSALALPY